MEIQFLLKGLLVGISVSAPLGPVGIISIQRTINQGLHAGIVSGLGAAFADTLYAIVTCFGITIISDFLLSQQTHLRVIGGLLLAYLGIRMVLSDPTKKIVMYKKETHNPVKDFISVFVLTISNPLTIITFGALFTFIGFTESTASRLTSFLLTFGIFSGALLWWLILSTVVNNLRHRMKNSYLIWINRVAGVLVTLFGFGVSLSTFLR